MNSYDIAKVIKKVELATKQVLLLILFSKIMLAIQKIYLYYAEYISLLYVEFT